MPAYFTNILRNFLKILAMSSIYLKMLKSNPAFDNGDGGKSTTFPDPMHRMHALMKIDVITFYNFYYHHHYHHYFSLLNLDIALGLKKISWHSG